MFRCVFEAIASVADREPARPALKTLEGDRYVATSFGELCERARAVGTGLLELGVARGDSVGLLSDNRLEWMLADLATTGIGAVDVPRGTDTPAGELQHILAHSQCRTAFVENEKELEKLEKVAFALPELKLAIVLAPSCGPEAEPKAGLFRVVRFAEVESCGKALRAQGDRRFEEASAAIRPEDLLTIIYTSGTTGRPKGVELTHANLLHQVETLPEAVSATPEDRWLSVLPPWHIFERAVEYAALGHGCSLAYSKPVRSWLLKGLEAERPTIMAVVPRILETIHDGVLRSIRREGRARQGLFRALLALAARSFYAEIRAEGRAPDRRELGLLAETALEAQARIERLLLAPFRAFADRRAFARIRERTGGKLRAIISGGAALPAHVDEFFHAIGIPILEGYGLTETSPVIAVRRPGRSAPFTVGHPLPGLEVAVVDDLGRPLPTGEVGHVRVRGPSVMRGYHRDAQATRAVLGADGWFDTGDLGYLLPGGELKLTGRAKDVIVLASGEKVEPEPLEIRLKRSQLVGFAMVTGHDGKQVCALIVPNFEALSERLGREVPRTEDSLELPEVRAVFREEIDRLLPESEVKPYERIRRFKLLPEEFKVGDELTPTLKLKREVVREKYREAIAAAS